MMMSRLIADTMFYDICSGHNRISQLYKTILLTRERRMHLIHQRCLSQMKYTAQLQLVVKEKIQSNVMRPRKHPGRRHIGCVTLPEELTKAVEKVTEDVNEEYFIRAKKLQSQIFSRRPPVEQQEYISRSEKLFNKLCEDNPGDLTEEQLLTVSKKIKSKLQCELKRCKNIEYDEHTCKEYLIARLAANYAAAYWVFSEIKCSVPSFTPKTFFDFGSGVGSAVWAAHGLWGKEIQEYFCVDASPDMNNLAELLMKGGKEEEESSIFKTVFFRQFLPASDRIKYDLVVSTFSLMELPSLKDRLHVVDTLWQKTQDTLVLIESGSYAGYSVVLDARDYILHLENTKKDASSSCSTDAYVVAPCPHNKPCPKIEAASKYPCNFAVSYSSPFLQKGFIGDHKERFSFVVLRRKQKKEGTDAESSWPRVVQPVIKRTKHVHCHLCCSDGLLHHIVFTKSKNGREAYKCARISSWGDLLPVTLSPQNFQQQESNSDSKV